MAMDTMRLGAAVTVIVMISSAVAFICGYDLPEDGTTIDGTWYVVESYDVAEDDDRIVHSTHTIDDRDDPLTIQPVRDGLFSGSYRNSPISGGYDDGSISFIVHDRETGMMLTCRATLEDSSLRMSQKIGPFSSDLSDTTVAVSTKIFVKDGTTNIDMVSFTDPTMPTDPLCISDIMSDDSRTHLDIVDIAGCILYANGDGGFRIFLIAESVNPLGTVTGWGSLQRDGTSHDVDFIMRNGSLLLISDTCTEDGSRVLEYESFGPDPPHITDPQSVNPDGFKATVRFMPQYGGDVMETEITFRTADTPMNNPIILQGEGWNDLMVCMRCISFEGGTFVTVNGLSSTDGISFRAYGHLNDDNDGRMVLIGTGLSIRDGLFGIRIEAEPT